MSFVSEKVNYGVVCGIVGVKKRFKGGKRVFLGFGLVGFNFFLFVYYSSFCENEILCKVY